MPKRGYIVNAHPPIRYHARQGRSMEGPFRSAVEQLVSKAASRVRSAVPRATGHLSQSVRSRTRAHGAEGTAGLLTVEAPYARHVLQGTRPHFVSGAHLVRWVRARNTHWQRGQTPAQAAWALARHIAMHGTPAYNYLEGPLNAFRRQAQRDLRRLARSQIRSWMRG